MYAGCYLADSAEVIAHLGELIEETEQNATFAGRYDHADLPKLSNLARTIRRAVNAPNLWETLSGGIPNLYKVEDSVAELNEIYQRLLDRKTLKL